MLPKVLYIKNMTLPFIEKSISNCFLASCSQVDVFHLIRMVEFLLKDMPLELVQQNSPDFIFWEAQKVAQKKIIKEIENKKYDLVFFNNGHVLVPDFFEKLKILNVKTANWVVEDPYCSDNSLKTAFFCDYIFTVEKNMVDIYQKECHKKAFFLPLGVDPLIHKKIKKVPIEYQSDLLHVSSPWPGSFRFKIMQNIIKDFSEHKIKLIGKVTPPQFWPGNKRVYSWKELVEQTVGKKVAEMLVIDNWIEIEEFVKYVNGTKIFLNIHRDDFFIENYSHNSRQISSLSPAEKVFAVAGCGTFQIVDNTRPVLYEFFEEGKEIVTFSDYGDLKEKIVYYLNHPEEREKIAQKAYEKVHREHTYDQRVKKVLEVCFGDNI